MIRSFLIASLWLAQLVKAATTVTYNDDISTSGGNLVTTYTLDAALTNTLVASYYMGGCLPGLGGGAIGPLGSPVVAGTTATITNDVEEIIATLNLNGETYPTSGVGTSATAEFCITVTICLSAPATGAICPISDVVNFVRVDIDYDYTFDSNGIVIGTISADPVTPDIDDLEDIFTATAFGCSGTTALTGPVTAGDDFDVCVEIDTADASTVEITSINSITLDPDFGNDETFSGAALTASTPCGTGVTICSATVPMRPRFVLNEQGVADSRSVGGTVVATFTLQQRRLRRRLRFTRDLLQTSRDFVMVVVPREEPSCDFEFSWGWFVDCLIARIMNRIMAFVRSAGGFVDRFI